MNNKQSDLVISPKLFALYCKLNRLQSLPRMSWLGDYYYVMSARTQTSAEGQSCFARKARERILKNEKYLDLRLFLI